MNAPADTQSERPVIRRKIALGLFHFNAHWGANARMAHRHCTEALAPFLAALRNRPSWRVNIEMSGSGLEFLERNYPAQFRLLRELVESRQVELLSSTYTPSLWIAYGKRDLLKSIELNQRCLANLGLPWTRIFFAQEAFFGSGVSQLTDFFDAAVCKDDYLSYYYDSELRGPHLKAGTMRVVVASGHLLKELSSTYAQASTIQHAHSPIFPAALEHIRTSLEINNPKNFPACHVVAPPIEYYWYHCGDGQHFGTISKPDQLETCYHDPAWSRLIQATVGALESQWELATIGDLLAVTSHFDPVGLPPLIEGGWNPKGAEGVFCWMGRNDTSTENDTLALSAVARARRRVIHAERVQRQRADGVAAERLEKAWKALLNAQISDTLGWHANLQAVHFALDSADQALSLATQIVDSIEDDPVEIQLSAAPRTSIALDRVPNVEVIGACETLGWAMISESLNLLECSFRASASDCGLRMPFSCEEIVFCPSANEQHVLRIPLRTLKQDVIALPLSNGLLRISEDTYVIKDTAYVHVAARVSGSGRSVEFGVRGAPQGYRYNWRLYFFTGAIEHAVSFANRLNYCD